jgi:photosystem II stability/assembly factor-like uncharacterized protein
MDGLGYAVNHRRTGFAVRRLRSIFVLALLSICVSVSAHTPQDAIDALHISPDYANDSTVFVIVQNYLLRSTNRGASFKQLVSGLDSQYVFSDISISSAFAVDGTLFVSTDGGGVYRSTDLGESWHRFNRHLEQNNLGMVTVAADASGSHVLAAGSEKGLFLSSIAEPDWQRVMSDDVQVTALRPVQEGNTTFVLAGDSRGGIWKSGVGLRDWRRIVQLDQVGAITALAVPVSSDSKEIFYAGTERSGLLKVSADGRTITQLSGKWADKPDDCLGRPRAEPLPDRHVRDIGFRNSRDGAGAILVTTWSRAVHVSRDGGITWELEDHGITCDNQADTYAVGVPHFRDLEVADGALADMFVAGFDGLYRSEDGGASWVQFETLPVNLIRGMAVSDSVDGRYGLAVTTYGGGAYVSADQGASWIIANQGLLTTRLADIEFSPGFPTDTRIYALSKENLLASDKIENGWTAVNLVYHGWRWRVGGAVERHLGFSPDYGTRFFLSDAERRRVWPMQLELSPSFAQDQTMFVGLREHGVWKSDDAGETWERNWDGPIEFVTAMQASPDFAADQTIFMGMRGNGIYVSRDGADSWQASNAGFRYLEDVRASASPNYYIDPPLYSAIKDVLLVVSPNYARDQTVFASSAAGLYKSSDGGRTWRGVSVSASLDDVPVNALGISPAFATDATVVVSFKGRGLFRSHDGGETFVSIGQDLLNQNFDLKLIEFSPEYTKDGTIFGATDEMVLRSRDRGVTWAAMDRPVRYENWRGEDRGPIRFSGDWVRETGSDLSASTQEVSSQQGAQAALNFYGGTISWIAQRGPTAGQARVLVDGAEVANIDLYSEKTMSGTSVLKLSDLEYGPHSILIEVSGTRNVNSAGYRVSVDGFDVPIR